VRRSTRALPDSHQCSDLNKSVPFILSLLYGDGNLLFTLPFFHLFPDEPKKSPLNPDQYNLGSALQQATKRSSAHDCVKNEKFDPSTTKPPPTLFFFQALQDAPSTPPPEISVRLGSLSKTGCTQAVLIVA
jgi:hypothetical protein